MTRTNRFLLASLFAALAIPGIIVSSVRLGEAAALAQTPTETTVADADKPDTKSVEKDGLKAPVKAAKLEGTWRAVAVEYDYRLVFSGTECSIVSGKRVIGCTFRIDPSKTPKWIDVTRTGGKKTSWPGIYELKDGTLKVFLDTTGGKRPTEFKTMDGTQQAIHTYERVADADITKIQK